MRTVAMCLFCYSLMDVDYESGRKPQLVFCPICNRAHKVRMNTKGNTVTTTGLIGKSGDDLYRCHECNGSGKTPSLTKCPFCRGKGAVDGEIE